MLYCRVCFFQLCGHRYEKAVLMALLYVMFFTFVTFPCGQCPGSGVVLDCIGSRSLSFLCYLSNNNCYIFVFASSF